MNYKMKPHKLICLHCNGKEFGEFIMDFPVEIMNETIIVETEASVCIQCNEPLMDCEQMDALRLRSVDKYKRIHELLQSHEIQKIAENVDNLHEILGISMQELKKYKTYYIQPKEIDDALRKILWVQKDFDPNLTHLPQNQNNNQKISVIIFLQLV